MPKYTQFLNLEQPLPDEEYDIAVFNSNASKIDVAVCEAGKALPPSATMEYYGDTPPVGFLFCEGQAVSREIYAELFAAIGVRYGVGDGSTTFNVPDHRGRVGVGKSTETEFNALGKKAGAKTHILTVAEIAAHGHSFTGVAVGSAGPSAVNTGGHNQNHTHGNTGAQSANHSHAQYVTAATGGPYGGRQDYVNDSGGLQRYPQGISTDAESNSHVHGTGWADRDHVHSLSNHTHNVTAKGTIGSNGSGTGHNNLQPYIVCNQIIKY